MKINLKEAVVYKPTEIKDDLVLGTTEKNNQPFQANLTDVVSIMNEALITDDVAKDSDSNHGIVEADEPNFDDLNDERDGIIPDNVYENPEELEDNDSPKDLAIFNLKAWTTELGMEQVLRADVGFSKGVCTFRGCCTNNAAANAFNIKADDIQTLLSSPTNKAR